MTNIIIDTSPCPCVQCRYEASLAHVMAGKMDDEIMAGPHEKPCGCNDCIAKAVTRDARQSLAGVMRTLRAIAFPNTHR